VDIEVIWVRREQEYFFERGWTRGALNGLSGKSGEWTVARNYRRCAASRRIITTVTRLLQVALLPALNSSLCDMCRTLNERLH
jgi:hypothetical protein